MQPPLLSDSRDEVELLNWTSLVLMGIGLWLVATALSFTIHSQAVFVSDLCSGLLLIIFGALSLRSDRQWSLWAAVFVGIWLQFAPLVFWAPDAISYLNDTLTGVLAIAFAQIIPGMSAQLSFREINNPPGWSFNPSAWNQRLPIVFACLLCWLISRYMAAYQLGYLDHVWDPFFVNGTLLVITSDLSKSFPISDAGLGALVYTLEFLLGCKGDSSRWHSMPWMVIVFGIMVIPAGLVSILLIVSQPILVGHWCGWCLITALLMLFMITFTIDEVVAVVQYLRDVKKKGLPFWKTFWEGGEVVGLNDRDRAIGVIPLKIRGINFPWNLVLSVILGIYLLFSPGIFNLQGIESDLIHVLGALVATVGMISMSETVRPVRFLNILFGSFLVIVPLLFSTSFLIGQFSSIISGILIIGLSFRKGVIDESYGEWNNYIY